MRKIIGGPPAAGKIDSSEKTDRFILKSENFQRANNIPRAKSESDGFI
jgi:hypothetical protein